MKNIIFLDIDGVLNCQVFYEKRHEKKKDLDFDIDYPKSEICTERIGWLNELCETTDTSIVISSTWRLGRSISELQDILNSCGATFTVIGKTDHTGYERGTEISKWLKDNSEKYFNVPYYYFYRYAIIDDDGDMLLWQANHFFQTDNYSGLTPTICYKIKRFFTHETF